MKTPKLTKANVSLFLMVIGCICGLAAINGDIKHAAVYGSARCTFNNNIVCVLGGCVMRRSRTSVS